MKAEQLNVEPIDERVAWVYLYLIIESEKNSWKDYRDKVRNGEIDDNELNAYFENRIEKCVQKYELNTAIPMFRARQIKSKHWEKIGKRSTQIYEDYAKILLSEEEIKCLCSHEINVPLEEYLYFKIYAGMEPNGSQMRDIEEINKRYSQKDFYGFLKENCGGPPPQNRREMRLSSLNDPYLYLAMDRETAIIEMRPSIGQFYSIAECYAVKPLILADVTSKSNGYADLISEPNTEKDDSFYLITQKLAHFLQSSGYDGIRYNSAQKKGKYNIVLFDEHNVDFVASEIVSIEETNVSIKRELPLVIENNKEDD